jgi:hypothetical protein
MRLWVQSPVQKERKREEEMGEGRGGEGREGKGREGNKVFCGYKQKKYSAKHGWSMKTF